MNRKALEEKLRKEKEALEKRIELYRQSKKLNFIRLALLKENYKIFDGKVQFKGSISTFLKHFNTL